METLDAGKLSRLSYNSNRGNSPLQQQKFEMIPCSDFPEALIVSLSETSIENKKQAVFTVNGLH